MKLKVPEIPKGIPSEKDPCPINCVKKTVRVFEENAESRGNFVSSTVKTFGFESRKNFAFSTPKGSKKRSG